LTSGEDFVKIRRIDRKIEIDILISMITSTNFLARIYSCTDLRYFKNSYCQTVARWCLKYFEKYSEAPKSQIEKIYNYQERRGKISGEEVDLIKSVLEKAQEQYDNEPEINVSFAIEKAEEYFNRVKLEDLFEQCSGMIEEGEVKKAQEEILSYKSIKVGESEATDGLVDEAELQSAFSEQQKPLFTLPGDIGEMVNSEFCRDKFIVLQAPEKTGKTFWLLWLALRALRARLKVVMFELEMTKNQVNRRMSISISGISDSKKYCDGKRIPKKFSEDGEPVDSLPNGFGVVYEDEEEKEPLIWQEAYRRNKEFYQKFHLKKDRNWKLITAPARSLNIRQIGSELDRLEKEENFIPDVVLIDYMDILGAENPREQEREKINSNWVAAKALCNKRHIFLASVTQSNSLTYSMDLQTRSSFSEDHRKYAHTNGTLGLTQTPDDKRASIAKINWLVLREGDFNEKNVCYILQCLKKGRFCVDSMNLFNAAKKKAEEEEKIKKRSGRIRKK